MINLATICENCFILNLGYGFIINKRFNYLNVVSGIYNLIECSNCGKVDIANG